MTLDGPTGGELDWLLADFAKAMPGVRHALVVSADGLRLAASETLDPSFADRLAAAASGLVSLSRGTAKVLAAEPVSQTIVEMAGGYLFVSSLSQGSTLTVYADRDCDIGLLGYEMTMLANRAGHLLAAAPRGGVPR
ncbi:roadblock/LC7 domain-containing protein [Pseudonocardia spinosispora]|uniref:roadblock/LC7 domain-containing protein n=1 Tax=Pseudonocardia spinosispora TaxID=103441 RepID=UPI000419480A|nr:roadblock/LC7 domain-containing protein [Pseudonocardia spinosispora]